MEDKYFLIILPENQDIETFDTKEELTERLKKIFKNNKDEPFRIRIITGKQIFFSRGKNKKLFLPDGSVSAIISDDEEDTPDTDGIITTEEDEEDSEYKKLNNMLKNN
jgi:hypothetical protein